MLPSYLIGSLLINIFRIYSWHTLAHINYKNQKTYIALITMTTFEAIITTYLPQYIKLLSMTLFTLIISYFLFSKNLSISLSMTLTSQIIITICKLIPILITSSLGIIKLPKTIILTSLITALLSFILLKQNITHKIYKTILETLSKLKTTKLILIITITLVFTIITLINCLNPPKTLKILTNALALIIYIITITHTIILTNKHNDLSEKYTLNKENLKECEKAIEEYKLDSHENRNEFLRIRNMIKMKEKGIIEYIDKLIDNKAPDNQTVINKTHKLPFGIRETIYAKLCEIEKHHIKYQLEISRDINSTIEVPSKTMMNVVKILGVFLDNAIDEVKNIDRKIIIIEIYIMDKKLCIDVANTYQGKIDLDKIDQIGYTSKGKNHGYGLSLVNKILKKDKNITHERRLNRDIFIQCLRIKL